MPPNVLLLVFDTARADAFEPYGAAAGATPAVAQLASRGQAVEDVFSTACWTLPSHASMFTGALPRALGLGQAPGGSPHGAKPVLEAQRDRFLPEVLRHAGYRTHGASANVWVTDYAGFATGFDEFEVVTSTRQSEMAQDDSRARLSWTVEGARATADDGAAEIERIIRGWLAEGPGHPFFWFVNLVECHSPYLPPKPYNDLGLWNRIRAAEEARRHLNLVAIWRTCLGDFDVPDDALTRMRHLYARSIRLLDDWLARVLEALDESGVLDETLVIVTSDHGENFGEGGLLAHAFSLDDRLIRVPFVTNRADFLRGDAPWSLVRLPAAIAHYVGLDDHPWPGDELPAHPAAQFEFVEANDPRVEWAVREWDLDADGIAMLTEPLTCVTDGRRKLLAEGDSRRLYDLGDDPLELAPLDPAGQPVEELSASLDSPALWDEGRAEAVDVDPDEVSDIEARMRLLGYM